MNITTSEWTALNDQASDLAVQLERAKNALAVNEVLHGWFPAWLRELDGHPSGRRGDRETPATSTQDRPPATT